MKNTLKQWFIIGNCLLVCGVILALLFRKENDLPKKKDADITSVRGKGGNMIPHRNGSFRQRELVQVPAAEFFEKTNGLLMQPIELRTKFSSDLYDQSLTELMNLWLDAIRSRTDSFKLDIITDALATRLRFKQKDSTLVLAQIQEYFSDSNNDDFSRWKIVKILGQAATRETLATLLLMMSSTERSELRAWITEQVAYASRNNWTGNFHEDFTEPLHNAWQSTDANSDSLKDLGFAIASVGSKKGLQLLFAQIKSAGRTVEEFEQHADEKAWVAFESLEHVRNPAAVPFLDSELNGNQFEDIITTAAGYCLSNMGIPEATSALLNFLLNNQVDLSEYVTDWFKLMRDSSSVCLVSTAIMQAEFSNPKNKEALIIALTLWFSRHSEENSKQFMEQ